jgi:CubicO group peptidase (beta-lactamase class C family)
MNTTIRVICFTLLFSVFSFCAAAEDFTNAIHAYLEHTVHTAGPNGCIVVGLVDEHGSRVVSYGKLDNGTDQEANGDTLFAIHSATGTFTRLLLCDMVARGDMQFDDPAAEYLPKSVGLPTSNGREITLRDLAMETSGLPGLLDQHNSRHADDALDDFTVEEMDDFVSGCQLAAVPGTRHVHGGVDMGLLGQAMALKAGMDYESLAAERIFQPLKMDSSRFTLTPELKSRLASEHDDCGFGYAIPPYNWGALKPLAGMYSTANDLLKCVVASLGLTSSSMTPLLKNGAVDFAYVPQPQAPGILHTGGGGLAGGAYAGFDRTHRRGVVILNTSCAVRRDLGYFLLQSEWQSDRRPTVTNLNRSEHGSYVGQYRLRAEAASRRFKLWPFSRRAAVTNSPSGIDIHREGDQLFAQATGSIAAPPDELLPPVAGELLPESETRFFERLSGRPITFICDHRGKVTGLTLSYQGKSFSYEKISDQPLKAPALPKTPIVIKLDAKLLDACVGQYEFAPNASVPAGMKLTIRRDGNKLVGQGFLAEGKVLKGDFDIYPGSATDFFDRLMYAQYTFVKGRDGQVTALVWHHVGQPDCQGKKIK